MSELLADEARKTALKEIIRDVESEADVGAARKRFSKLIADVSPEEIAELEQSLIADGMPAETVRSLCDLHVEVFRKAVEGKASTKVLPGHPVDTYKRENRAAEGHIKNLWRSLKKLKRGSDDGEFVKLLETLRQIEIHYRRKENQLFPFLEQVGFTGPSSVMWQKHDDIRKLFRETQSSYVEGKAQSAVSRAKELGRAIKRMIFMEEKILFPTAMKKLPESTWAEIRRGEAEIGYSWIAPGNLWDPSVLASTLDHQTKTREAKVEESDSGGEEGSTDSLIGLDVGRLNVSNIDRILRTLPLDITFVDEDDVVRYYSNNPDRVFPRSPGIIGRKVQNCHPPTSLGAVESILDSFREGRSREAEFWLEYEGKFIYILYIAQYDDSGAYRGVLEVSQDATHVRSLVGEKRLVE